ncbi:MAG: glycosyltransferase family 4 protein, partial [Candidatus Omnitrophica bacterium]|nr:glycosyltransferase family 4 protein [Candidatus Omnitrophota bacterium]
KFGIKCNREDWDNFNLRRFISYFAFLYHSFILIKKIRPEIIHVHAVELGFLVSFWARLFGIPLILTCHSILFPYNDKNFLLRTIELFLLKLGMFSKIITVDVTSLKFFEKFQFKDYLFLPVGIDENFIKTNKKENIKLNNKIRFLFVGRLELIKGLDYLLNAAKILLNKTNNFEIVIVGNGSHKDRLENICKKSGLSFYIKFLGAIYEREKLKRIYESADVFVMPSLREWCPTVILEAWATGLAVITTNASSIAAICSNFENVILIPPKDELALSNAMLILIEDARLREVIAKNGKEIVQQNFSYNMINRKIEGIYSQFYY